DRVDDLGDLDIGHLPRQLIAATGTAHTGNQTTTTQLGKQLLEVGKGNPLTLGNIRQGHRPLLSMQGQIKHGRNGVSALCSESHGTYHVIAEVARLCYSRVFKSTIRPIKTLGFTGESGA